jgi:N-acetylmuramoyl-L-alanine amidase
MTGKQRLKRRLFEGMAADNLELIHNKPRGTIRRQRREARMRRQRTRRRAILAGGSLVVIIGVVLTLSLRTDASADRSGPTLAAGPFPPVQAAPPVTEGPNHMAGLTAVINGRQAQPIERGVIPLAVRTVVVDPGHGGKDSGTLLPQYGILEKEITWDIAERLRLLLEADFDVVMTRTGDETVALKERTEIANRANADLFVSIHVNWLPDREARGFETYFAGSTVDPFLKRLAAAENRDSGFSMADTRRLLDGIYSGVRLEESRRMADWVSQSLFDTLHQRNPAVVDRGVMRAPFVVLVATEMPAVLAEVACISNDREARMLGFPWYRQSIAEALYSGIRGYARELSETDKGEPT